jgi:Ca2+/Na+ antiporter
MNADIKPFLELLAIFTILTFHAGGIIYVVIVLNFGVWNTVVIVLSLLPYFVVYAIVKKKHEISDLEMLTATPKEWNVDDALIAYASICKKKDECNQSE